MSAHRLAARTPRAVRWARSLAVAAVLLAPLGAHAQEVRFPRPETRAQRELARFVAEEVYEVWTRDTVLARDATVPGNILVLEGAARIAGRVEGSVYVADGDLFLRPGARIAGDVVVVGGGFYSSGLADVEGRVTYRPAERLRVLPEQGDFLIFAPEEEREAIELGPAYGFRFPHYQRVDGWVLRWGGLARATGLAWRPELEAEARYRTEPSRLDGIAALHAYPGRRVRITAEGGRSTRSNDRWIRTDLLNTAEFALAGNDYRDYYRADHAAFRVELAPGQGWTLWAGPRWEDATSLDAGDRTGLFGSDDVRPNPPIDDGEAVSLVVETELRRRVAGARTRVRLQLEGASDDVAGDFSYLYGEARAGLRRPLGGHAVELLAIARGDLAGSLPRQRWSALGGIGTLPTFPILALRGPRAFMVEATYFVPIEPLEVPYIGPTEILGRAVAGSAWGEGESARIEQNLVLGARFLFLEAALAWDPGGRERDLLFYVMGRFPRG